MRPPPSPHQALRLNIRLNGSKNKDVAKAAKHNLAQFHNCGHNMLIYACEREIIKVGHSTN